MRSRGGELVESRDVSLIFVAPPIAIEVFFTASQSQPSTAYATFTSALPPVDIDYFSYLFFVRISPNKLACIRGCCGFIYSRAIPLRAFLTKFRNVGIDFKLHGSLWLVFLNLNCTDYLYRSIRPENCERALAATAKASWRGDWNQRSQKGAMNGSGSYH